MRNVKVRSVAYFLRSVSSHRCDQALYRSYGVSAVFPSHSFMPDRSCAKPAALSRSTWTSTRTSGSIFLVMIRLHTPTRAFDQPGRYRLAISSRETKMLPHCCCSGRTSTMPTSATNFWCHHYPNQKRQLMAQQRGSRSGSVIASVASSLS
jgi:hypothetical protein